MIRKKVVKYTYFVVVFLFLFSPFVVNYKIFLNGEKTTGKFVEKIIDYDVVVFIKYYVDGIEYEQKTKQDYAVRKQIRLIYNSKNPEEFVIISLATLYFAKKMLFIDFLFLFISATFFTLIQTKEISHSD